MKKSTRRLTVLATVAAASLSIGAIAATAQHGCGHGGMDGSHAGHGSTAQTARNETPEAVRATLVGGVQVLTVVVRGSGYTPSRIAVRRNVPVRLLFEQTTSSACAAQVQIPDLDVAKTALPKGVETPIEFTPTEAGTYVFTCGMEMLEGTIVVE